MGVHLLLINYRVKESCSYCNKGCFSMQDLYQIASKKIKFRCKLDNNENIKLYLKTSQLLDLLYLLVYMCVISSWIFCRSSLKNG